MVVLKCMLERGEHQWTLPITAEAIVDGFMNYLNVPYRKKIDTITDDRKKAIKLIETMPMTKLSGSSKGLVTFTDGEFAFAVDIDPRFTRIEIFRGSNQKINEQVIEIHREMIDKRIHRLDSPNIQKGKLNSFTTA